MAKNKKDLERDIELDDIALPQTDDQNNPLADEIPESPTASERVPDELKDLDSQTDPDNPLEITDPAPGKPAFEPEADNYQTDSESAEHGLAPEVSESQTDPQITEGEKINPDGDAKAAERRRPAGRPRKKAQSDTDVDSAAKPESESTQEAQPAPRTRRTRGTPVVSIDERRTVETADDKMRNDLLDLVESQKGKRILTDTIQGVERSTENPDLSYAVIYHGSFKVIIPAKEAVYPPADFRDQDPADVYHYLITKRLGAEVDYIVKGIDPATGIAAASRLEAMAAKRREYYYKTDRDGNYQIYDGVCAETRVVSVIRAGLFVDLFGVECYIPLRELSYQRWVDATAHYQPGQRVLVKVIELDRSDRNNIHVQASVKQAGKNPYEEALKKYTIGSRYVGTVSVVDTNGVFVALDGGIDCLCSYPKRGRPPRGSRVTVRVIGINHDNNRIWGVITHMTMPR